MLKPGEIVAGEYEIIRKVGEGGSSTVYLAMERSNGGLWAVKVIKKSVIYDQNIVNQELVTKEADLLTHLRHPVLPKIRAVYEQENLYLIVMEFIEGITLAKYIEEHIVSEEQAVRWMLQLANALSYLHSRVPQIIYRDMKPDNIIIRPNGNLVMIDFGTAREYKPYKMTGDTRTLGTVGYAAPEQYNRQVQTDARTDIYCLGVTMHQIITKQDPAKSPFVFLPIREYVPQYSEQMEKILKKCTQMSPENRYQSSRELVAELEQILPWEPAVSSAGKKSERYVLLGIIFAILLITVMIGIVAAFLLSGDEEAGWEEYGQRMIHAEDSEEALQICGKAMQEYPQEEGLYALMMDAVLEDGAINDREWEHMEEILNQTVFGDMTVRECFKKEKPEEYMEFCYEMAVCVFMGGDDIHWAQTYTSELMDSNATMDYDYVTGYLIDTMIRYMDFSYEEGEKAYLAIWEDFENLWNLNPVRNTYYYVALWGYKVFTEGFLVNYEEYVRSGIDHERMRAALEQIERQTEAIIRDQTIDLDEEDYGLIEDIRSALDKAYQCLESSI